MEESIIDNGDDSIMLSSGVEEFEAVECDSAIQVSDGAGAKEYVGLLRARPNRPRSPDQP